MATTIELTIDGYPVTWEPGGGVSIQELIAAVKAAKQAGAQPRRREFGGKPGQRPQQPAPSWDAQGRPCCPTHGGVLRFRANVGDGKYLCQHEGADGKFDCRYGLSEAELAPFAAARFYEWAKRKGYGVASWADVQRAGVALQEPATLAEWRAAAQALARAKKAVA